MKRPTDTEILDWLSDWENGSKIGRTMDDWWALYEDRYSCLHGADSVCVKKTLRAIVREAIK